MEPKINSENITAGDSRITTAMFAHLLYKSVIRPQQIAKSKTMKITDDVVEYTNVYGVTLKLPHVLNTQTVADIMGVTTNTIFSYEKKGKIPAGNRSLGHPRWNRDEILMFLQLLNGQ